MDKDIRLLYVALQSDNVEMLSQLINTGLQLDLKVPDPDHVLPPFLQNEPPIISMTVYYGARNCFKLIADRYQEFFAVDNLNHPITLFAILGGDCDLIDMLKKVGQNFSECLPFAAQNGKGTVFRFIYQLYNEAIDLNSHDETGNASIHYAAQNGDFELIKFLKDNGAEMDIKNKQGMTALALAAKNGYADIVRYLAKLDAVDVNSKDIHGVTPLYWCVEGGYSDCVSFLLEADGVKINETDENGFAPLHVSALKGYAPIVTAITTGHDADVTLITGDGRSVLHCAAENGNEEIVKYILSLGKLDVNLKSKDGIFFFNIFLIWLLFIMQQKQVQLVQFAFFLMQMELIQI